MCMHAASHLQVRYKHAIVCFVMQASKAILTALRPRAFSHNTTDADAAACNQLRTALLGQVPAWVHSIPSDEHQFALDLVTAVVPDVDYLGPDDLAALMTAVLTGMEQKQLHSCILLELLPACLAALQAAPAPVGSTQAPAGEAADGQAAAAAAATAGPSGGAAEAAKHRDAAIHRLSHCQWQTEQVCQILSVLKCMALTPEQLKALMAKAIRAAR